jgi:copper(I)-binding protein
VILRSQAAATRRPVPRRLLAVAAAAALIPVLAGCEAGNASPTQQWHQPTEGAGVTTHGISIRNVFVLGPPPAGSLPQGGSAGLFLFLANNKSSPDKLTGITAQGYAESVTLPGGSVSLAPDSAVRLTGPTPQVILTSLTKALPGGSWIKIVLSFQDAGNVTLSVPVMPAAQYYATFSPPPTPAPTPTPTATATPGARKHRRHHKRPGAGASATPTPSPSSS